MPRAPVTRLREQRNSGPIEAPVIEPAFTVVGERTVLGGVLRTLLALGVAAVIGFLIPPLWVLVQSLREMMGR